MVPQTSHAPLHLAIASSLLLAVAALAQKPAPMQSAIQDPAHPDDEDGGMLTYKSRGLGARVAMLTLTRGEGAQNLMTVGFNDTLGLIPSLGKVHKVNALKTLRTRLANPRWPYLIVYDPDVTLLRILRVLHGARNPDRILKSLYPYRPLNISRAITIR